MFSCSDNEDINKSDITSQSIKKVLNEMKSLGDNENKVVTFELKNILKKDYKEHFKLINYSQKVLAFAAGTNRETIKKDNYTVTCTWGDGSTKVTECGANVGCAGQATWDCLENGGCATICNAKITYKPAIIN
jgi:hypothetical protein